MLLAVLQEEEIPSHCQQNGCQPGQSEGEFFSPELHTGGAEVLSD